MKTPFQRACDLVGAENLAKLMGITPQSVSQWRRQLRGIPLDRCAQVEKATNCAVTCEELRPDKREFWEYMRLPTSNPKPKQTEE